MGCASGKHTVTEPSYTKPADVPEVLKDVAAPAIDPMETAPTESGQTSNEEDEVNEMADKVPPLPTDALEAAEGDDQAGPLHLVTKSISKFVTGAIDSITPRLQALLAPAGAPAAEEAAPEAAIAVTVEAPAAEAPAPAVEDYATGPEPEPEPDPVPTSAPAPVSAAVFAPAPAEEVVQQV